MEHGPDWPARVAASVGRRVAYFRDRTTDEHGRKLTAQALADRCAELGLPLARPTIAKLEKGLRETITVGEVQVLARALGVSPIELLFPLGQAEVTEVLPGKYAPPFDAMQWFADEAELTERWDGQLIAVPASHVAPAGAVSDYHLFETHQQLVSYMLRLLQVDAAERHPLPEETQDHAHQRRQDYARQREDDARVVSQYRTFIRERGLTPPALPEQLLPYFSKEEIAAAARPVVAAIVTSSRGVLVGRRNDRTPPWGFITGEIEPGELAEDAAVREVKEETGLEVRAGQVIGERDHPATGRHMIYMAAKPVRGTKVIVGDEAELAEVRWVGLDEADELLPGMFGPVRQHLEQTLGQGSDGPR